MFISFFLYALDSHEISRLTSVQERDVYVSDNVE